MDLRKDYILDRWVFLSNVRKKRPQEFIKESCAKKERKCFFCPGNEENTPNEIGRLKGKKSWKIRWFPNKFPAVLNKGNPTMKTAGEFYSFSSAYGKHEVIAETPSHEMQLWDLSIGHITQLLGVYKERINSLINKDGIKYVIVFKNSGWDAGTSIEHSHTQVVSVSIIPPSVKEEIKASKKFKGCPYCRIVEKEKRSKRKCFENKSFAAFAPYASRFNFEVWIFPKKHAKDMNDLSGAEMRDLAAILKKVLARLKKINAPYNFFLHYAPHGEDLHFHIEIAPRFAKWAGFEFASGAIINEVLPEDAAKFYRGR